MIHQRNRALLVAAAGTCLALGGCGGGSATAARGPAAAPTISAAPAISVAPAKLTGHFCADANAIMRAQPSNSTGQKATVAVARADLQGVLRSTITGFTALKQEAPSRLRGPIKAIIGVYTTDERQLATYESITQMGASIVRASTTGPGGAAFRQVLTYISTACK
jgi:hypothetical protein